MKIVNFAEMNSELNRFVAEIRDIHIQQDRLRFRKNLERIGEVMSYEISKLQKQGYIETNRSYFKLL